MVNDENVRWRCPECGGSELDQYRMPYGAMWCTDCGFRVEDKTAVPNPFLVEKKRNQASPDKVERRRPGLGEQLAAWLEKEQGKKE